MVTTRSMDHGQAEQPNAEKSASAGSKREARQEAPEEPPSKQRKRSKDDSGNKDNANKSGDEEVKRDSPEKVKQ